NVSSGSAMMSPTVIRGLREAKGSWKIIWISLRVSRRCKSFILVRSWPNQTTSPSVASTSPMMARAKVDLPQPDSPTTPSVSPS
ncbi:putative lipoprotein, partial [Vibrio parahaemolyticus EKP-026]